MQRPRNHTSGNGGGQPSGTQFFGGCSSQNRHQYYLHHQQHRPPFGHYQQQQWRHKFHPNYPHDRPRRPPCRLFSFVIQLRLDVSFTPNRQEIEALVQKLKCSPDKFNYLGAKLITAALFYEQWNEALETMVELWEVILEKDDSKFTPRLVSYIDLASDKQELNDRLKVLFIDKLKRLMDGDLVQKWVKKLGDADDEIKRISNILKKPQTFRVLEELRGKREALEAERDLISKRVDEFKSALRCIIHFLENGNETEGGVELFHLEGEVNWERIYSLSMREQRRLDHGLPIYAHRRDLLMQIHCQQVTVLRGETGSGKSTQLVQFLADSGMFGHESIVCTQPRKLAAISLAERVKEESSGCSEDNSVISCLSRSSFQEFGSKVIFMTDHCLLQHYMTDKQLSQISCIIVDEAHERSLNTDLLLAMIKNLLDQRPDLRLIIMSATADADQLADYFFDCGTFHVAGRNHPVDIKYLPCSEGSFCSQMMASYVLDVVRVVMEIHKKEKDGTILAFLTSQMEVEWACEKFQDPSAVALPLHGKLSYEDQHQVFLNYPGKRKVIFTTNLAETSLTIPGVKYVVDSGLVKESRFDPATGMNVLKVCRISQSSANQRAGRAGRTEPGTCYRLYTKDDYCSMLPYQDPEIRMVHLGVAVLRILALGIKNVQDFDFVDAPSVRAIEMAMRNLVQLGAVVVKDNIHELTKEGWDLVKLGIEPRLGKIILKCFNEHLGKEGLVLAAVMANASSIFCRVGTEDDKMKSDCLKVKFAHQNGDLFTLLSVYKEWEAKPREEKSIWCWENSINAKSMKRCRDTVQELETCLRNESNIIVPSYWLWTPHMQTEHDETLKKVILSSLAENVAMYSGYDQLGYEVASSRKHVQLHPSCSLLNFCQRPQWVVFGEVLSISNEYLVCVTAFDFPSLSTLSPPPLFDFLNMERLQLQKQVLSGFGSVLLKKFCGKCMSNVRHLVSCIRTSCLDERIGIEVCVDRNEICFYASSQDMERVFRTVNDALEYEIKLLKNECMEKCLYKGGPAVLPSIALFGAGAEIKHLELEKRFLTVDILHTNLNGLCDKDLLMFLERSTLCEICSVCKFSCIGQDGEVNEKWGRVTFLTADAAMKAVALNRVEYGGGLLKVVPSRNIYGGEHRSASLPSLKAKIYWPRRCSKGVAIVKCDPRDVEFMVRNFSDLMIRDNIVRCVPGRKYMDSVMIIGLSKELDEADIIEVLKAATNRQILDFFLLRGDAVDNPPITACQEAILREISPFMPRRGPQGNSVCVQVFPPEPKDGFMRALITFDGNLHLEAAKALEQIDGKVLPGCLSWQRIRCQQMFHSSVSCPAPVYLVIRKQLDSLISRVQRRKGAECILERNQNGSYRVKISASATKVLVELRRPLEQLMKGKILEHADVTPAVIQHLFSRDGVMLMKSVQRDTGTCVLFDKQSLIVRVFGSPDKIDIAQQRLIKSLLALHDSKRLEIQLRGELLPPDMLKRVVQNFGSDLHGLKEKFPEAEFSLNARRHCISIIGAKELKQKVEGLIRDIVQTGLQCQENNDDSACPICLCELEDGYKLEGCRHEFCRLCLVEQCESAVRSQDTFPLVCTHKDCGAPLLLTDLRYLLSSEKLEELFRASLGAFVAGSGGAYRFCPSPDCPSVYRVADPGTPGELFACGSCFVETCTRCHMEYHPYLSCKKYQEFKADPDSSLKEWSSGRENVKKCPCCGFTIEKVDGCNHIECRCGRHVCWVCLDCYGSSDECYGHLRSVHMAII